MAKKKTRKRTSTRKTPSRSKSPNKRKAVRKPAPPRVSQFILNCVESEDPGQRDFTFSDAVQSGAITISASPPSSKDLRKDWWTIQHQGVTGACVGFAAAHGVLWWHFVKAGLLARNSMPSARFIWMANKETDGITSYPTTFLEPEGTQTKLALHVAYRYGCVPDTDLPMNGQLSPLGRAAFYTKASALRLTSYNNLGRDLGDWRQWIANQGPILTRLGVDSTWDLATQTGGHLKEYLPDTVRGGHAVALVGYTSKHFIVRNSWGTGWGDGGFAYASNDYADEAFTEAYGAVV